MVAIKDMEMPKCCKECPLFHFYLDTNGVIHFICKYENLEVLMVDEKRSGICPLVNIEMVKMERDEMKYKTIDNPCYHCYVGAIGECSMTGCKYLLNSWSQDLESETIEILDTQAESEDKK